MGYWNIWGPGPRRSWKPLAADYDDEDGDDDDDDDNNDEKDGDDSDDGS